MAPPPLRRSGGTSLRTGSAQPSHNGRARYRNLQTIRILSLPSILALAVAPPLVQAPAVDASTPSILKSDAASRSRDWGVARSWRQPPRRRHGSVGVSHRRPWRALVGARHAGGGRRRSRRADPRNEVGG